MPYLQVWPQLNSLGTAEFEHSDRSSKFLLVCLWFGVCFLRQNLTTYPRLVQSIYMWLYFPMLGRFQIVKQAFVGCWVRPRCWLVGLRVTLSGQIFLYIYFIIFFFGGGQTQAFVHKVFCWATQFCLYILLKATLHYITLVLVSKNYLYKQLKNINNSGYSELQIT